MLSTDSSSPNVSRSPLAIQTVAQRSLDHPAAEKIVRRCPIDTRRTSSGGANRSRPIGKQIYTAGVTPGERINAKREIAALLAAQEWGDIDLTLSEHGLQTTDRWSGEKYDYVIEMLKGESDESIAALHAYVTGAAVAVQPGTAPWRPGELRLFMSHLATNEKFVGDVATWLDRWGISAFAAHISIEASEEWQAVIETGLLTCDAMAVFLHAGFKESNWCDQEVGFALARRVPVLPLKFDLNPYGFMGKLQAARCVGLTAAEVGEKITQWLLNTPSAQTAMTEGLVTAFERVDSFAHACEVFGRLQKLPVFSPDQLQRLDAATRTNMQIKNANWPNWSGTPLPGHVQKLIADRGGTPPAAHDPWDVASIQD